MPLRLGPGTAGLVRGSHIQAGQTRGLESPQANDPALLGLAPNETDLRIELISRGAVCLRGADNYDSLRGDGLDFLILDEYPSIDKQAWTEALRPSLAHKQGRALFIGTPRGYNHLNDLYTEVQDQSIWSTFQFTTEEGGQCAEGGARKRYPRSR